MADNEIFSEAQMRSHVRDTLQEWLRGYTDSLADGHQRRIEIVDVDDNWITVRVQRQNIHGGYDRRDKHYQIAIEVKEVDHAHRTPIDTEDRQLRI